MKKAESEGMSSYLCDGLHDQTPLCSRLVIMRQINLQS